MADSFPDIGETKTRDKEIRCLVDFLAVVLQREVSMPAVTLATRSLWLQQMNQVGPGIVLDYRSSEAPN
jgi:hypothetical protein